MTRARDLADGKHLTNVDSNTLVVDATNNRVGVGEASPAELVHIKGASGAATDVQIQGGDDTNSVRLFMGGSTNRLNGRIVYDVTNDAMQFSTSGNEQMRVDAGGSMLLGATTPTDLHNTWRHIIVGDKGAIISQDGGGGVPGMTIADNAYVDADTGGYAYQTTDQASKLTQEAGALTFSNAASGTAGAALSLTERLRIDSSGNVGIGTTSGGSKLDVRRSDNDQVGFFLNENSGFSSTTVGVSTSRNTTGGAYNHFQCSIHGVAVKFNIYDSGNVVNVNNSYGQLSDQRMKENIADASSQWDDIKALQVRNFNFIGDDLTQIGVVAQEVEAAGMNGLIQESAWFDAASNPDSEVRKTVKYSVLYMKAVKALQEAMTRIETLETEMTALKARVTTLEGE